jgi:hypothetical protein
MLLKNMMLNDWIFPREFMKTDDTHIVNPVLHMISLVRLYTEITLTFSSPLKSPCKVVAVWRNINNKQYVAVYHCADERNSSAMEESTIQTQLWTSLSN